MEFLHEHELTARVRHVLGGKDLICAVAFWGTGAADFLRGAGADPESTKIICNVHSGGTYYKALEDLTAAKFENMRWVRNLHAKVYVSEAGAVVGSANATSNGLAFNGRAAGLEEAACFIPREDGEWNRIRSWAENLWARTDADTGEVDPAAIEEARKTFRPTPSARKPKGNSLLDLVRTAPASFGNIGFVFVGDRATITPAMEADLREDAAKHGFPNLEIDPAHLFESWSEADVENWPEFFFEFWVTEVEEDKPGLYTRQCIARAPKYGAVYSRKLVGRTPERLTGRKLPALMTAFEVDRELAQKVLHIVGNGEGVVFRNGGELKAMLDEIDPDLA